MVPFTWAPPNVYSGSAAQPQHRNCTRIIVKFFVLLDDFVKTPIISIHSALLYMPQPSKSDKKKATGITKACQLCHNSWASSPGLWVPDFKTSPITPEDSRSSSPGFKIFTSAWFPWTEIQCSRSHWGCWSPVHLPSKVSLWTRYYWVLLACCNGCE